jgi:hypothetical protein
MSIIVEHNNKLKILAILYDFYLIIMKKHYFFIINYLLIYSEIQVPTKYNN